MAINVDPSEVNKFDVLANRWWDKTGPCKPLHEINPLRLAFIEKQVALSGKAVLDIGCGGGILAESLATQGALVSAIDISEEALNVARAHAKTAQLSIDYEHATPEAIASAKGKQFDVVTCMELLEHVPDPASVVQACSALLKPKGVLFFATLNRTTAAYLKAIVAAEYLLRFLPIGTHDYDKFIRPSELDTWARASGLTLESLEGMTYNPLSREYSASTNVSVNYMAYYQKV